MMPIKNRQVTYPYGSKHKRYQKGYHTGSDIFAPKGTPVLNSRPGIVVRAGYGVIGSSLGNAVVINCDPTTFVRYCHLDTITVKVGQQVGLGAKLGTVGTSGTLVTGPHLHAEVGTTPGWGTDRNPAEVFNWKPTGTKLAKTQKWVSHEVAHGRTGPHTGYPSRVRRGKGHKITVVAVYGDWLKNRAGRWWRKDHFTQRS